MFDYSKKTFLDIVSELLSKVWFRIVFGIGLFAITIILAENFDFLLDDAYFTFLMIPMIIGLYSAISVFNNTKYKIVDKIEIKTPMGEPINYAVVKKKVNCIALFPPFSVFSILFWVPHEVKYYLVRDAGNIDNKYLEEKITPFFLINLHETIRIKSKDLNKLREKEPEYISELIRRIDVSKKEFNEQVKKYIASDLLELEYESRTFSIYGLPNAFGETKFCTFYTQTEKKYLMFLMSKSYAEKVKLNPATLFLWYSFEEDSENLFKYICLLDDKWFDSLKKQKEESKAEEKEANT